MISAIILAGGKGKRMGANVSKQFILVNGKPILYYTIKKFIECEQVDQIILVLPKDEIDYCKKEVIDKYNLKIDKIVSGGKERQDSVFNALCELDDEGIVLIHDGARPFVSQKIIKEGIIFAEKYGAAAPGVIPKDTIKVKNSDGFSKKTLIRSELMAIQTPQTFKVGMIKECHKKINQAKKIVTDDTMVVEMYNNKVYLYEGDYKNLKVTTPEDLWIAEKLADNE